MQMKIRKQPRAKGKLPCRAAGMESENFCGKDEKQVAALHM